MIKRLLYIIGAALALTACRHDVDEVLLGRSDISLTIKDELLVSFNENTCQLGYNTDRNEFRVYDEKFANWFILKCSADPTSEGKKIKADLEYTTDKDVKSLTGLELSVVKTSPEGLIWLWEDEKKIGIIIKNL
jgi:hypothetical protein